MLPVKAGPGSRPGTRERYNAPIKAQPVSDERPDNALPFMNLSSRSAYRLLAALIALVILVAVLRVLPWDSIELLQAPFRTFDVRMFLLTIVLTLVTQLLRAVRLRPYLHHGQFSLFRLFCVLNVANFFNNTMPFRTGELSFLYLSKKHLRVDVTTSLSSLLIVRIADLVALCFYFSLALILHFGKGSEAAGKLSFLPVAIGLLVLFSLIFYHVGSIMRLALRVFFAVADALHWSSAPLIERIRDQREKWLQQLDSVKHPRTLFTTLALSLLIFFLIYLTNWLMFFTFDFAYFAAELGTPVEVDLVSVIIAVSCVALAIVLPVNFVANVGTYEAGWMLAFVGLLGWGASLAAFTALWTHTLGFITMSFDALLSWILLNYTGRSERDRSAAPGKPD